MIVVSETLNLKISLVFSVYLPLPLYVFFICKWLHGTTILFSILVFKVIFFCIPSQKVNKKCLLISCFFSFWVFVFFSFFDSPPACVDKKKRQKPDSYNIHLRDDLISRPQALRVWIFFGCFFRRLFHVAILKCLHFIKPKLFKLIN